jgi:NhaP-type Na+/H+ or K+/H+ antiporter
LLFAAGFQFSRQLLRSRPLLRAGLLLALPGTLVSIGAMALVIHAVIAGLISLHWAPPMTPVGRNVLALALAICLAPSDWAFFTFMTRRIPNFEPELGQLFDFEAALGSAMTLLVGAAAIDALQHLDQGAIAATVEAGVVTGSVSVLGGLALAVGSGTVLAVLMTLAVHQVAHHRSHQVVLVLGFLFLGFGSQALVGHGGLLCALVMGMVSSLLLDRRGLGAEKRELVMEIEAINLVAEAVIFFFAGVTVVAYRLPLALCLILVLLAVLALLRPLVVAIFTQGSGLSPAKQRFLGSWSAKGAMSIGLAAAAPELIHIGTRPETPVLDQFLEHGLLLEVVVGVVLISMVVQSVIVPRLHRRLP